MKKIFVLGALFTLLAGAASAQVGTDRSERQRIERGWNSGELTRPEKRRLESDRFRYNHERRRDLRDGRISPRERRHLRRMRRHERHETFRFRHNGRRRAI